MNEFLLMFPMLRFTSQCQVFGLNFIQLSCCSRMRTPLMSVLSSSYRQRAAAPLRNCPPSPPTPPPPSVAGCRRTGAAAKPRPSPHHHHRHHQGILNSVYFSSQLCSRGAAASRRHSPKRYTADSGRYGLGRRDRTVASPQVAATKKEKKEPTT